MLVLLSASVWAQPLGTAQIRVVGMSVDIDTRPDVFGMQYTMTGVKDIPTGVQTVVGTGDAADAASLPVGCLVKAELSGPSFPDQPLVIAAAPNQLMAFPPLRVPGDHFLSRVRLEDIEGRVILERDPSLNLVVINVIDKLLVTQVTSRPLTMDEIRERGIVIDADNYTALNFTIGLTLGSEHVTIDLPVLVPGANNQLAETIGPSVVFGFETAQFQGIKIPNLSISGFSLKPTPEVESEGIEIPPINGVIIIPGNIAFLHQFFSVMLQASNQAPDGSGLVVQDTQAAIALPLGADEIEGTGDDPLRVAETQGGGAQKVLPLIDATGSDALKPQGTNQAEFLVEGLREGAHQVTFDVTGNLVIPSLGKTVPLTGRALGVVQVKNPTFSLVLAHPDVVRDGEDYSIFATVTNTSSMPANLFKLALSKYSLSGCRLAEGETGLRTLDSLDAGQAQSFEFYLVARTTGKVTGTVFLADEGITGSFVLTTGVGDTGIPLSPDTLVLPQTVDYLPDRPDVVFAAVRLLGQAYSVATAPAGTLPPGIARISREYVLNRGVKLAQAGLHVQFGETPVAALEDILLDYLGNDRQRFGALYPDAEQAAAMESDLKAFDDLRRKADAGHDLAGVFGQALGTALSGASLADFQQDFAERFASRPLHISFGVRSHGQGVATPCLRVIDGAGRALGRLNGTDNVARDIPFAEQLPLLGSSIDSAACTLIASPDSSVYTFEFMTAGGSSDTEISVILPKDAGMVSVRYSSVTLPAGSYGRLTWNKDQAEPFELRIDTNGDGTFDQVLLPTSVAPIEDRPPGLLGVRQWAKGNSPLTDISFVRGDPIGRLVGFLFNEEVEKASAEEPAHYQMPAHQALSAKMLPDRRMVFLMFEEPMGPFIPRDLTISGIQDMQGHGVDAASMAVIEDPDRGVGGMVSGIVQGSDGRPISFARIKYIQPLFCESCNWRVGWTKDYVVSRFTADAEGRYQIDFVLQDGLVSEMADNWLNDLHAAGTDHFKLEATDPETGEVGKASSRIQYDGQRMALNVIIRGYGAIEGTVFDEQGNVVAGGDPGSQTLLNVVAQNVSTGETYLSWVDAQGHYAFPRTYRSGAGTKTEAPHVAVGNIILRMIRPSDGATAVASTNVPAAGAIVTQDLVLLSSSRYGKLSGRVLEVDGVTPAASVEIVVEGKVFTGLGLYSRSFTQAIVAGGWTDENGGFRFESIPAGDVTVYAVRRTTYEQSVAQTVLGEGEEQSLTLVLPGSGGIVRGVVRDPLGNLVAGARVLAVTTWTETDAQGRFEIRGLPIGRFPVSAQSPESPASGRVDIQILAQNDVQEVVITLEPVGSIQGTVYEADGVTPAPLQEVALMTAGGRMALTNTDRNGYFRFENYPVREYTVIAVQADYGDGGMVFTSIRYAGDLRDVDIVFRGLGEVKGRVIQSNGTPVIADVVIVRNVWRVSDGFFFLLQEPALLSSNILGPGGEVTGRFEFKGSIAGGPFRVAAFGPFLAPAEVTGEIPKTTDPTERIVDVGDIVLEPATGEIEGTVYMPDGVTPVGENVKVKIRCLDNSGSIQLPGEYDPLTQPVLPEYDVVTDPNGYFYFPLVLRGHFILTADTGVPDPSIAAHSAAEMQTERFQDDQGNRLLNVRLYGQAKGVVPAYETLRADIRLRDVAGLHVNVVENNGVTPVPFAEVTLKTESDLDKDEEARFSKLTADENGAIDFFPVIEGRFSVSGRMPETPWVGQAEGEVPADPPNGFVIPVTVTLGAVTTGSGEVVSAAIFGTVEGTLFSADGAPLKNPAQVRVRTAGISLLTTSEVVTGRYRVEFVPGGPFQVEVFEPFTARRGTASGWITADGQVVNVPVTLLGLGSVRGQVFTANGNQAISGADVVLYAGGSFTDPLISRTDAQGSYSLPGVPLGAYTVRATDYASGLSGESVGEMLHDGDTNTTDIYLESSGVITGTVYGSGVVLDDQGNPVDADGNPWPGAPVAPHASVTITGPTSTQTVQAGADGAYVSGQHLKLGAYTVTARPPTGDDGGSETVTLTYEGELAHVSVALLGAGTVRGTVLDSLGLEPVDVARVTLESRSPYSSGATTRITGPDGAFVFDGIPVGEFSIAVVTTVQVPQLGCVAHGVLERHGQTIVFADGDEDPDHNALRLQECGRITGSIVLADGVTAAEGAVVELTGAQTPLAHVADSQGGFAFEGIPLGTYRLAIYEPVTNQRARRPVTLAANGEVVDLGAIVLDGTPPRLVSTSPGANAVGVPAAAPIVARFSELIDPGSVNAGTFAVAVAGVPVEGTYAVSDVEPVVTFTPKLSLPGMTRIQVQIRADKIGFEGQVVQAGIKDRSGLGLVVDYVFIFTTGDTTPPALVSITPLDGAVDVLLESVIRIEFSEPVDRNSIRSFTLTRGGEPVAGGMNSLPILGDRVFVFTPDAPLSPNRTYTATMTGPVRDLFGNAMPDQTISTTFATLDTVAPNITALTYPPGTVFIHGKTVRITAELEPAPDVAGVEFYVNGALVSMVTAPPYAYDLYLAPQLGSTIQVGAIAVDLRGNRSSLITQTFTIAQNQPPVALITSPVNLTAVSPGETVTVTVEATDDIGITQITFVANNGVLGRGSQDIASNPAAQATFTFTVPADYPIGATIFLRASAKDTSGFVVPSNAVTLTVKDMVPPQLVITNPADHARFDPGAEVSVAVTAEDASGISTVSLATAGALVFIESHPFDPPQSPATATFTFTVPADAQVSQTITVTARAIDAAGNANTQTITLGITDRVAPNVRVSGAWQLLPGREVAVTVSAYDEGGLAQLSLVAGDIFTETRTLSGGTDAQETFRFTVPETTPLGTKIIMNASAQDTAGNIGNASPYTATVMELNLPSVAITSPAAGSFVFRGQPVQLHISATDDTAINYTYCSVSGAVSFHQGGYLDPPRTPVEIDYQFTVPENAPLGAQITIYVMVQDIFNNQTNRQISVIVNSLEVPKVARITPPDGAINVGRIPAVEVVFDKHMNPDTITPESFTVKRDSAPMPGSLFVREQNTKAVWAPHQALDVGATYTVALTGDVHDDIGNALEPFTSTFTAGGEFVLVTPQDGQRVSEDQTMRAEVRVPGVLDQSTMLYYPFNGDAVDASGQGEDGVLGGAPTFAAAQAEKGIVFGGSDYVIRQPFLSEPLSAFTVSFWMKSNVRGVPFSYITASGIQEIWVGCSHNEWDTGLYINLGYTSWAGYQTNVQAFDNTWHHIALTWDNVEGYPRVYKDGQLAWSYTYSPRAQGETIEPGGVLVLGQDQTEPGGGFVEANAFRGTLDDVKVFNRSLSAIEIEQEYRGYSVGQVTFSIDGSPIASPNARPYAADYVLPRAGAARSMTVSAEVTLCGSVNGTDNVALLGTASSSSVYSASMPPEYANDGQRGGDYGYLGLFSTAQELHPWWQVDLGEDMSVGQVDVYLRTDCCFDRDRFVVLVASDPFVAADFTAPELPQTYANGAIEVYRTAGSSEPNRSFSVTAPFTARYVRIVHPAQTQSFVTLAEVEVYPLLATATISLPPVQVEVRPFDEDSDNDGLLNWQEIAAGTDPFTPDADADPDSDGFTNAQEIAAGTDCFNPDTDGDGILDGTDPKPLEYNLAPFAGQAVPGAALHFDTADKFVQVPSSDALTPEVGLSIEAWVYLEKAGYNVIVSKWGYSPQYEYYFGTDYNTLLTFCASRDGYGSGCYSGSHPLTINTWHHVALVWNGTDLNFYVDGILDRAIPGGWNDPINRGSAPLYIGEMAPNWWYGVQGVVDEVRIWSIARTEAEIQTAMYHPLRGDETGLVSYWPFDEGTGDIAADASGRGADGLLGGGLAANKPQWEVPGVTLYAPPSVVMDAGADVTITLPGADPNNDPITAIITALPANGTLYHTPDGVTRGEAVTSAPASVAEPVVRVIYAPNPGFSGHDTFVYVISDGFAQSDESPVSITVLGADTDQDGLGDRSELETYDTDPFKADTDDDGLNDGVEVNTAGTDPCNPDTDDDGLPDGQDPEPLTFNHRPVAGGSEADLALRFDGVDDFASTTTYLDVGANDLTLESWFRTNSAATTQMVPAGAGLAAAGDPPNTGYALCLQDGKLRFLLQDNKGGSFAIETAAPPPGTWHHATGVLERGTWTAHLYLDGVLKQSGRVPGAGSFATHMPLSFGALDGAGRTANTAFFSGDLDEVRIWKTVRTAQQIRDYMCQRRIAATTPGLLGYWAFRTEDPNSAAADLGSGPSATLGGGVESQKPEWVASQAPVKGDLPVDGIVNEDLVVALDGFDMDQSPLAGTVTQLPAHGALYQVEEGPKGVRRGVHIETVPAVVSDAGGRVIFAPDIDFLGDDSLNYRVSDGTFDSEEAVCRIGIVPVNHAPNAADHTFSTPADTPLRTPDLRVNSDPDGDPLVIESFTQPANGLVIYNNDGTFTYMPNPGFAGTDTFTYVASDGGYWNRYKDFVPGPTPGTSEGNPSPDRFGNRGVWAYEYLPVGNPLSSPDPWYLQTPTPLVWDDAWYSGSGQWVFQDDTGPNVSSSSLLHLVSYAWNNVPVVRWINPVPNPAHMDIRGTMTLTWMGDGGVSAPVPIDVVIVLVHGDSGGKDLLFGQTCQKPIQDTSRNVLLLPIRMTAVPIEPGDSILVSLRVQDYCDAYMGLSDGALTLAPSGSRSTGTCTVSVNVAR
jgi:hypothetical protein